MLSPDDSQQALAKLFQRQQVADLETLFGVLKTTSRMSVFRRLSLLGYLTSYSHNGRYYTLADTPEFDADGLWRFQSVCFSRHGSLKATLEYLVKVSEAGQTHPELAVRLQVRVHNGLLELVQRGRIQRELLGALYLYVSADPQTAAAQVVTRRQDLRRPVPAARSSPLRPTLVIEVLLEVIHGASPIVGPDTVRERLSARSVSITLAQVQEVFVTYGLKKTAVSRSPRSRR